MQIDPAKARLIARAINWYLTPYALFLVAMAAVASGLHRATEAALAVAAVTGIGNPVLVELMRRHPAKAVLLRNVRIAFNYFFNIFLVYLLWPYWAPVWMLLLLSISAVGIFESRRNTITTAGMFSAVLLVVESQRGAGDWAGACRTLAYIATLWTAGLLINHLTHSEAGK